MADKDWLDNAFDYHKPTEKTIPMFEQLRREYKALASLLMDLCPMSREKIRALDLLEQSMFNANASIARHIKE